MWSDGDGRWRGYVQLSEQGRLYLPTWYVSEASIG